MGKITVLFNNIKGDRRLKTGWGSSFLVEEGRDIVLYDTGPDAQDFLFNVGALKINLKAVKKVVISHNHNDHKGALKEVLGGVSKSIELYLPGTIKKKKRIADRIYVCVIKRLKALENILVINAEKGLIILTGCAHPGIYKICRTIKEDFGRNIYAVFGGFHLEYHPGFFVRILGILLRRLGIEFIGANHCTGRRATEVLRKIFKDGFIDFGCGEAFLF